jgi:predicted nucleic acid-binding protein
VVGDGSVLDASADAEAAFAGLPVGFSAFDAPISLAVAEAWRAYRQAGGTREPVVADFLIGAHTEGA